MWKDVGNLVMMWDVLYMITCTDVSTTNIFFVKMSDTYVYANPRQNTQLKIGKASSAMACHRIIRNSDYLIAIQRGFGQWDLEIWKEPVWLPSGKRLHKYGKIHHFLAGKIQYFYGKITIFHVAFCMFTRPGSAVSGTTPRMILQLKPTRGATAAFACGTRSTGGVDPWVFLGDVFWCWTGRSWKGKLGEREKGW